MASGDILADNAGWPVAVVGMKAGRASHHGIGIRQHRARGDTKCAGDIIGVSRCHHWLVRGRRGRPVGASIAVLRAHRLSLRRLRNFARRCGWWRLLRSRHHRARLKLSSGNLSACTLYAGRHGIAHLKISRGDGRHARRSSHSASWPYVAEIINVARASWREINVCRRAYRKWRTRCMRAAGIAGAGGGRRRERASPRQKRPRKYFCAYRVKCARLWRHEKCGQCSERSVLEYIMALLCWASRRYYFYLIVESIMLASRLAGG